MLVGARVGLSFREYRIPGAKARRALDSVTVDVKGSPGEGHWNRST